MNPAPTGCESRRTRVLVECLALFLIGWLIFRTWVVEGLVIPLCVTGGSMAPGLPGARTVLECHACGFVFECGLDNPGGNPWAVCPNCGDASNDVREGEIREGDRLLLDKFSFRWREPRRWEVAAFHRPSQGNMICVKRIAGLPGETVAIRGGDLWIDGRLVRKTLPQQRAMAVLVHDADWTSPKRPAGWTPDTQGGWRVADGIFSADAPPGGPSPVQWCEYRHYRSASPDGANVVESPIDDELAYNHGWSRRMEDIHPMRDLMLAFEAVRLTGSGRLWIAARDGQSEYRLAIAPATGRFELFEGGNRLADGHVPALRAGAKIEISLFDRQFLAAVDGHVFAMQELDERLPPGSKIGSSRPWRIGASGVDVELRHVRIYRDVYYGRPIGEPSGWRGEQPFQLGPADYFMLGDNSDISDDSRSWRENGGVPGRLLCGRPFLVHFPSRQALCCGRQWQFPDFSRIRLVH